MKSAAAGPLTVADPLVGGFPATERCFLPVYRSVSTLHWSGLFPHFFFLYCRHLKKKENPERGKKILLEKSRGFSLHQAASRSVRHLFGPLLGKSFSFFSFFFVGTNKLHFLIIV